MTAVMTADWCPSYIQRMNSSIEFFFYKTRPFTDCAIISLHVFFTFILLSKHRFFTLIPDLGSAMSSQKPN